MKVCIVCGIEKGDEDFYKGRKECKECKKEKNKKYYQENKEYKKEYNKEYNKENKENKKEWSKKYNQENKEHYKEHYKERKRKYRKENKEKIKEYRKEYYQENKEYINNYNNERRKNNTSYRIHGAISGGMRDSLKSSKNGKSWESLVDYNTSDVIKHLKSLFTKGMTIENHGEWHIDHIRPKASFNITCTEDEDFKLCWALENLQPLWALDNISKGARWDEEQWLKDREDGCVFMKKPKYTRGPRCTKEKGIKKKTVYTRGNKVENKVGIIAA